MKIKATILTINGRKVVLKDFGSKQLGLCPFHEEQTPSFVIDLNTKKYYCFGCGAKGKINDEQSS